MYLRVEWNEVIPKLNGANFQLKPLPRFQPFDLNMRHQLFLGAGKGILFLNFVSGRPTDPILASDPTNKKILLRHAFDRSSFSMILAKKSGWGFVEMRCYRCHRTPVNEVPVKVNCAVDRGTPIYGRTMSSTAP